MQTFALKGGYTNDNISIKNVLSYQDRAYPSASASRGWIYNENNRTLTNELKATQTYNNGSTSLYGIYLSYNNFNFDVLRDSIEQNGNMIITRSNDRTLRQNFSFALFTDHKILLPANFDLSIGLRYSYYKAFIHYIWGGANGAGFFTPIPSFKDSIDTNQLSGRIALSYTLLDSHKLYTSFSRAFKEGGYQYSISSQQAALGFKPETNYSAEIGYKGMLWNDRIYINMAYFFNYAQNRQDSVQVPLPNGQTTSTIYNMGDMLSHGVDFEGKLQFLEDSFFALNFVYVDAKYLNAIEPFTGQPANRDRVYYLPALNLNMSLDSAVWKSNFVKLYVNTLLSYKSRIYFLGRGDNFSQAPFWLWDIGARAEFKNGISLSFRVENVLDTLYSLYGWAATNGRTAYHIGRLRNYSATLSYKF